MKKNLIIILIFCLATVSIGCSMRIPHNESDGAGSYVWGFLAGCEYNDIDQLAREMRWGCTYTFEERSIYLEEEEEWANLLSSKIPHKLEFTYLNRDYDQILSSSQVLNKNEALVIPVFDVTVKYYEYDNEGQIINTREESWKEEVEITLYWDNNYQVHSIKPKNRDLLGVFWGEDS